MKGVFWMLAGNRMRAFEVDDSGSRLEAIPTENSAEGYLVPGFVDIHIHGAFGIDFMSASTGQMLRLADRLCECGYEFFYPTTVTASASEVWAALNNLPHDPRMPGIHLEGPFISPDYPGAQPPSAIRGPLEAGTEWEPIFSDGRLKVITLAPEQPGALSLCKGLSEKGVRVSMGHTNASFEEAQQGFAAGVRHATHTFNAMRPLHHREAGAVGFALHQDELYAELIYDRHHVATEAASILLKTKPKDKVIAVSDSTMATGLTSGSTMQMWNLEIELKPGKVVLKGTDTLAGSAITVLDAFKNLAEDFDVATAIRACSLNPRTAMGITSEPNVWIEFDPELELRRVHRLNP